MVSASSTWLRGSLGTLALAALDRLADRDGAPGKRFDWTACDVARALTPVTEAVLQHGMSGARLVRAVGFTKDAVANWGVPWHQDRVIAVRERHDVPGLGNWSKKGGIWHCEPPITVLQAMRFVRVHLDDCNEMNGAMEIARGSEAAGAVSDRDAAEVATRYPAEVCAAQRGDIQILPMLVLHRSRPARSDAPRRVLRLDYALAEAPEPLAWHSA
jgi:hypothetical protein